MYAFDKRLRNQQHTRRYSIESTPAGWEVREERDQQIVRRVELRDWHRVERVRRAISHEVATLEHEGWSVGEQDQGR